MPFVVRTIAGRPDPGRSGKPAYLLVVGDLKHEGRLARFPVPDDRCKAYPRAPRNRRAESLDDRPKAGLGVHDRRARPEHEGAHIVDVELQRSRDNRMGGPHVARHGRTAAPAARPPRTRARAAPPRKASRKVLRQQQADHDRIELVGRPPERARTRFPCPRSSLAEVWAGTMDRCVHPGLSFSCCRRRCQGWPLLSGVSWWMWGGHRAIIFGFLPQNLQTRAAVAVAFIMAWGGAGVQDDVNGGNTTNGTVVDLYDCNGTAAQEATRVRPVRCCSPERRPHPGRRAAATACTPAHPAPGKFFEEVAKKLGEEGVWHLTSPIPSTTSSTCPPASPGRSKRSASRISAPTAGATSTNCSTWPTSWLRRRTRSSNCKPRSA